MGEPATRVAESAARPTTPVAAAQSASAHAVGEPTAGRHGAPEPAAEPTKTTGNNAHPGVEPANQAKPTEPTSGRHAAPEPGPEPVKNAADNNGHPGTKPDSPDPRHAAKPGDHDQSTDGHRTDTDHTGNDLSHNEPRHPADRWQDVARHSDEAHARALADDALSRRIPPVEPEGLRAPHGSRDQAIARAHDNSDWWHQLSGEEQRALIDTYPRHIGNAEGIPPGARHEANSHTLNSERDALRARQDNGERLTRGEQKYLNRLDELERAIREGERKAQDAGVGGPYILALDPHAFKGDGRAIVAFGDNPYKAQSVSWHVPGLTTTIDKLATNMSNAFNHLQSTRQEHPGISASSIAWIGYDAPSGLGSWRVAGHGLARVGGDILHGDISAFNLARDLHAGDGTHFRNNHIFGHSYGSTTTSYAGAGGRLHDQISTVTLLGSPGAGPHRTADGFNIGRENVFVASSSRDWVTTIGGRDTGGRFMGRFGLGRDPAMDTWGGQRITSEFPAHMSTPAGTVGTHTAYYHYVEAPSGTHPGVRTESLANFGRIASGHPERLDFEHHRTQADGPRWRPGLRTEEPAAGRPLRLDPGGSGRDYSVERHGFEPRWRSGDDDGGRSAPPRPPTDGDPRGGGAGTPPRTSLDGDHRDGGSPPHTAADGDHRGGEAGGPDASTQGVAELGSLYSPDHVSHALGLPEYRPATLDVDQTRIVYITGEQRMAALHEDMLARGVDLETRARTMFETRNELRSWARELMSDREAAAVLNAGDKNYTWAQVVEKYSDNNVSPEKTYERIIEKSMTSRPSVNEKLGLDPHNPPPLPPVVPAAPGGTPHNEHSGASPPPSSAAGAVRSELDDDAPAPDPNDDASAAASGDGHDVTFTDPARPTLGSDGKYHVSEGATEVQIDKPDDLSRTITDIDRIENGVLWEEKSATSAANTEKWVQKQFVNKMEKYIEAQQYITGYENAPIGVRFTTPGVDPGFKAAVESAASALRDKHPDITILIDWPS
ncbi:alpha/beta hydrolase [Mycolicibacterium senegalense]